MISKLILLRHGESQWNKENKFTGWTNVDLTKKGESEAKESGVLIKNSGFNLDFVYVSLLKRAVRTADICLNQLKNQSFKVINDWRLNERHYGALQGLNKSETAKKYGDNQVLIWRRSFDTPPPKMDYNDRRHPTKDKLYENIDSKLLPSGESLKDTLQRVQPLFDNELLHKIQDGNNILIVAHGNSLRAIVKILKKISDQDIIDLNIPTGTPCVVELDQKLEVLDDYYLGNRDELKRRTKAIERQGKSLN